ncbi:olfactory receptor 13G1-like [Tiliqua scincoides]|uniref:olfactory receptor 13G1-like n=1 Tax=Tiliqua scincoides TaxID=71010 RepID=UPI0034622B21
MAYDRYAAICHPLHYTILMRQSVCRGLLAISWIIGNISSMVHTALVFSLTFCHSNEIDHFFCDIPPILHLSCSDVFIVQLMNFTVSVCVIIVPFSLTLLSYILIVFAVLKIRTAHGKIKAFSTCASHLTVVSIFYGTIIYTYIRPSTNHSLEEDRLVSVLYAIITPLLNPRSTALGTRKCRGHFGEPLGRATASLPPMVLPFTEMDLVKSRTLVVLLYHVIDGDRLSMPPLHESTSTTAVMSQSKDVLQFHDKDDQRRTE